MRQFFYSSIFHQNELVCEIYRIDFFDEITKLYCTASSLRRNRKYPLTKRCTLPFDWLLRLI